MAIDATLIREVVMSDEAANIDLLKDAYRRWSETRGDTEIFLALSDPDIKFGSIPRRSAADLRQGL